MAIIKPTSTKVEIRFGSLYDESTSFKLKCSIDVKTVDMTDKLVFDNNGEQIFDQDRLSSFNSLAISFSAYNRKLNTSGEFKETSYPHVLNFLQKVSQEYHLNEYESGTPAQLEILALGVDELGVNAPFEVKKRYLEQHDVLYDPDCNFEFGNGFVAKEIPKDIVDIIHRVMIIGNDKKGLNQLDNELQAIDINSFFQKKINIEPEIDISQNQKKSKKLGI